MLKKLILLSTTALLIAPAALAGHRPAPPPAPRMAVLAHDLHDATYRLEAVAFRRAGRPLRLDAGALRALDRLEDKAQRFERTVTRTRSAYALERDFVELDRAFRIARNEMRFVHWPPLRRDFNEITALMNGIADRVDVAIYRDSRWRQPRAVHRHDGRTHGSVAYGDFDDGFRVRVDW